MRPPRNREYGKDNYDMRAERLFLSPPHMSGDERVLVGEAFDSNYIAPVGPMIQRFEQGFCDYTGFHHAVAVSSGTAALHLGLRMLELKPGDSVMTSTLTFIAGVAPVSYVGAVPIFIDCDPVTLGLDVDLLAQALKDAHRAGTLPKAIVPTDLFGQSSDLDPILALGEEYGVPVFCDSAEAVGAFYKGRHAGKGAWAAAFSFNGNKIITTSGGGILASDDAKVIERARYLSTQARQPFVHYEHTEAGYNYRLSNVSAAIGVGQLRYIEDRVTRRRAIFDGYSERLGNLPGLTMMPEASYGRSTRWLTVVFIDKDAFGASPEDIRLALESQNIEARPIWKPMHMQPVYADAPHIGGETAERLFTRGLCLPSGSQLTPDDQERVCEVIRGCRR